MLTSPSELARELGEEAPTDTVAGRACGRPSRAPTPVSILASRGDEIGEPFLLLDVRPRAAFRKAHIRGAWCLPYEELRAILDRLPRDQELVTYCWSDY